MSEKPRKSLRQLADEAAQSDGVDPWACPRCGCKDWRTVDSRLVGGTRKRKRACRNCHQKLPTQEVLVPRGFALRIIPEESDVT
jgi:hypothetical protein